MLQVIVLLQSSWHSKYWHMPWIIQRALCSLPFPTSWPVIPPQPRTRKHPQPFHKISRESVNGLLLPIERRGFASRVCGDCLSYCVIADPVATAINRLGSSVSYSTSSSPGAVLLLYWRTVQYLSHYLESWTFPDFPPNGAHDLPHILHPVIMANANGAFLSNVERHGVRHACVRTQQREFAFVAR